MAKQLKLRRGTTAQHSTFTGAEGEVTVDTTKDTLVVHDGVTAGGFPLQKEDAELTTLAGMSSSRATFLASTQPFSFRNRIINGAMNIWQRGTSFASVADGTYAADRFSRTSNGTGLNTTLSQSTDTPSVSYKYSLQCQQVTSNATSVIEYAVRQRFELLAVRDLAGKNATVSFLYKSNRTGTHCVRIGIVGTGVTGGADISTAFAYNAAGAWQLVTVTLASFAGITSWGTTADTDYAAFADVGFCSGGTGLTGTINANDYFRVTGWQVEAGSAATPFEFRPYGTELALCQRYFYRERNGFYRNFGVVASGGYASVEFSLPVTMRTTPTMSVFGYVSETAGRVSYYFSGAWIDTAAVSPAAFSPNIVYAQYNNVTVASDMGFRFSASAEL